MRLVSIYLLTFDLTEVVTTTQWPTADTHSHWRRATVGADPRPFVSRHVAASASFARDRLPDQTLRLQRRATAFMNFMRIRHPVATDHVATATIVHSDDLGHSSPPGRQFAQGLCFDYGHCRADKTAVVFACGVLEKISGS